MVANWTITLSYLAYAAMLAIGATCWLTILFDHLVYARVDAQLLDRSWLDFSKLLMRGVRPALWTAFGCGLAGFTLAALPAGEAVQAHKAYQLRTAAIVLCFVGLLWLTRGRMGAFDVDLAAVVLFAWLLWVLVAGWLAFLAGTPVSGPSGWWLALMVDLLALAAFAAIMLLFSRSSRLF